MRNPFNYYFIELAVLGSLHGHIKANRGQPDMELSVHWATGVARGMSYLHENDVVHRDLKSANGIHKLTYNDMKCRLLYKRVVILQARDFLVCHCINFPAVLLTSKKTAKLCDFGISRKMDHTTEATMAGTYAWMAPEVISLSGLN